MRHALDDNEDFTASVESSRHLDSIALVSLQENEKEINVKIIELNETFKVKVFGTDQCSVQDLPTYLVLDSATSMASYNIHKSTISQHLKNKPKYTCSLINKNQFTTILGYFTSKEYMSLNMDYRENSEFLLSFMLSPYKDSVFFEDIGDNSDRDFSISLTSHITYDMAISFFLCKYILYA